MRSIEKNPSVVLLVILLFAGLLRIVTAWVSLGFDHPNEIYRLLEPLALLSGYTAHVPWEWTDQLLSRLPVLAHLKVLDAAIQLGITSAIAQVRFLHILYGIFSLIQVYCTWRLVRLATRSTATAGAAALCISLWPELVYQSVRLMDYSLEASFLAIAVLLVFGDLTASRKTPVLGLLLEQRRVLLAALGGVFLGMLFFVRYQSGLHLISFCTVLLWEARGDSLTGSSFTKKAALSRYSQYDGLARLSACVLAYALTVGVLAWIEAPNLSEFLLPFKNYIHFNWTLNGAEKLYGAVPWHRYFSEIAKFFGIFPLFLLTAVALCGTRGRKILFLTFFPVLIHSLISHKEGRFVFGCLFLLIPAALCEWNSACQSLSPRSSTKTPVPWQKAHWVIVGVLVTLGFGISVHRTAKRVTLRASEVTSFAEAGESLSALHLVSSLISPGRLTLATDPVHSPGAFFLRWKGALCYEFENRSTCSKTQKPAPKGEHFYFMENSSKNSHRRPIWTNSLWSVFSNHE